MSTLLDGALPPAQTPHLFGHAAAERFLAESYSSGKGHHAILIEGPEGIGKATLAFRFAYHVLTHPEPAEAPAMLSDPDPQSLVYRQIVSGASHNLLHLTRPLDEKTGREKSAITVEEVRRAGRFFSQTSGTGNWRIVIVDPADDLNRNAANALLKILEEPPRRALFLVLTHAPGKLLPTIRSRCLPLALRPLSPTHLAEALGALGVALPAARANEVLTAAKGSVAEALKLVNHGGLDILEAFGAILSKTDTAARKEMHRLADVLSAKDSGTIFDFFTALVETHVQDAARQAARAGEGARADRLASLSTALTEKLATAEAYNLDRKQTILSLIDAIRAER
ncbi:DNA polymerase III subunit delta' [Xaviernesmea oryzae]|uniref:DNA polymerase III subunit delta n=1 Tax=Xaviernesmea oryzae TaxID=464029 RepID=A0A1Q9AWQ4_9HYPH|nr:DNA polymerase III subunit delta' [Xaviernesmea oryzae]OLP59877.1 DNA polymerase III subunit delta' [Xaviernesmea oryzae]SEK47614.1 DNA polymerase-3 subunit delta' [Xaviernesmea oryzae]